MKTMFISLLKSFSCYSSAFFIYQDRNFQPSPVSANQSQAPMFGRAPTSPWMPFSMLFAAISTKVSPQDMDLVNTCYEEFKVF